MEVNKYERIIKELKDDIILTGYGHLDNFKKELENFREEIAIKIMEINQKGENIEMNSPLWEEWYQESKNEPAIQVTLLKMKNIPEEISDKIIKELPFDYRFAILVSNSCSKERIQELVRADTTKVKEEIETIQNRRQAHINDYNFSTHTFECILEMPEEIQEKLEYKHLSILMPTINTINYINDKLNENAVSEDFAIEVINNMYLPSDIKKVAFDSNANLSKIKNATPYIKDKVYQSCIETINNIKEYNINSEELTNILNTLIFLYSKVPFNKEQSIEIIEKYNEHPKLKQLAKLIASKCTIIDTDVIETIINTKNNDLIECILKNKNINTKCFQKALDTYNEERKISKTRKNIMRDIGFSAKELILNRLANTFIAKETLEKYCDASDLHFQGFILASPLTPRPIENEIIANAKTNEERELFYYLRELKHKISNLDLEIKSSTYIMFKAYQILNENYLNEKFSVKELDATYYNYLQIIAKNCFYDDDFVYIKTKQASSVIYDLNKMYPQFQKENEEIVKFINQNEEKSRLFSLWPSIFKQKEKTMYKHMGGFVIDLQGLYNAIRSKEQKDAFFNDIKKETNTRVLSYIETRLVDAIQETFSINDAYLDDYLLSVYHLTDIFNAVDDRKKELTQEIAYEREVGYLYSNGR